LHREAKEISLYLIEDDKKKRNKKEKRIIFYIGNFVSGFILISGIC